MLLPDLGRSQVNKARLGNCIRAFAMIPITKKHTLLPSAWSRTLSG